MVNQAKLDFEATVSLACERFKECIPTSTMINCEAFILENSAYSVTTDRWTVHIAQHFLHESVQLMSIFLATVAVIHQKKIDVVCSHERLAIRTQANVFEMLQLYYNSYLQSECAIIEMGFYIDGASFIDIDIPYCCADDTTTTKMLSRISFTVSQPHNLT
jgi:hypothetical protein